jgi:hypothetical protein
MVAARELAGLVLDRLAVEIDERLGEVDRGGGHGHRQNERKRHRHHTHGRVSVLCVGN